MSRLLSCPHGHQWHEPDDGLIAADSLACPVCGVAVSMADVQSAGTAKKSETATVLELRPQRLAATLDQPPPELPDFEILEEIGRGGTGIVYRARQKSPEEIVAIKVIRKDRLQHEEA